MIWHPAGARYGRVFKKTNDSRFVFLPAGYTAFAGGALRFQGIPEEPAMLISHAEGIPSQKNE